MKHLSFRRLPGAIGLFIDFIVLRVQGKLTTKTLSLPALFSKYLTILALLVALLGGNLVFGQSILWTSSGGSAWLTGTNWTGNAVPTATQIAQFGANPTAATGVGVNFANPTNAGTQTNGQRIQEVGAIEVTSARAAAFLVGNSSATAGATGTLSLSGVTVNSVANTILRNASSQNFTIQNIQGGGTQTMAVSLGNATANVVNVDGSGNIIVSSSLTGIGKNITFNAGSTGDLRLSGTNTYDGGTTVNSTSTGRLRIDATTALPTLGTVRINSAGVMRFNVAGTYGGVGQALEFNPNQTTTPSLDINFAGNATWQGTVNLLADTRIEPSGSGNSITFSGTMSGAGTLVKASAGTLIFSGTGNALTGGTTIGNGVLAVNSGSSMGGGPLLMSQTSTNNTALNLNNTTQTISSLTSGFVATTGTQTQIISLGSGHTLTINQSTNTTYGTGSVPTLTSTITGSGGIVKSGNGTLTLTSANGYTGSTTITGGTLALGIANALASSANIVLNGGTLSTTGAFNQTVGTLNLNANSTIALGTGAHSINFAASNGIIWNGTTLTITGWTGSIGIPGTAGKLFVGSDATGLTAAQLAKISFTGYPAGAIQLSTGEVVPTCPAITATLNGTSTICTGISPNLTATITGGTGPYSLTYSNGTTNTTISNYTSGAAIAVTPMTSTTYTIVGLTDASACPATMTSGTAVVTVNQPPTVSNAGTSQTITTGTSATLAANTPTTGTGSWSVASGPSTSNAQFSNTTDPAATFTPAGGVGNYVLTWTIGNAPCTPSGSNVTITVVNPVVNLSVSSSTASEAAPMAITVTATASAPVVGDQTVSLAVTGTGITAGDYTLSSPTITILNGQTAGFVTFTVVDDNAVEGTETAILTISNPPGSIALGSTVSQSITITDNDVAPGLSINDVTLAEGNTGTTTFTFTVSLATPAPTGGVTFDIATANNTATQPSDYTAKSLTGQIIPEGSSTYTFDVLVNGDTDFEPDETFFVNVTNVTGATVSKGQGMGIITNDDTQPLPDLTVALTDSPDPVVAGNALTYSFTVTNSGTANAPNTSVSFPLPTGTTFASFTTPGGWIASTPAVGGTGTVTATNASVAVNDPATFALVVTPTTANPSLSATVSVSTTTPESNTLNNSATTTTTVNAANQPPVAPAFTDQTGIVAVPYSYTVPAFTDPEGQALTYTITGVPAGLMATNTTRVISGTPTTTGPYTVTVVATDPQSASTTGNFTITINANQAPVASMVANQTATVGVAFSLTVPAFSDPENQTLTYIAIGVPSPLMFNPTTRIISGTPSTTGVSTIIITATDPASNTASVTFSLTVNQAPGQIRITEYMYSGTPGEYIELTNVGGTPVDLTNWTFNDNTTTDTPNSLSALGIVQPGQSVIYTEADPATFKRAWFLPASVVVAGPYSTNNLGRSGEINIFDGSNTLVQKLVYGDNTVGGVRTQNISAYPTLSNLYSLSATTWTASAAGDAQYSYVATSGNVGNPGGYFIPLNRVKVVESGGNTSVTEGGNTDTYTVALNSPPTANVTITITPGSQLTLNTTTLTFTPANYNTVQTVTVTAIDDAVYQGAPRSVTITQAATSSDATYNGIAVNPVSVTIIDNDVPANVPPTIQVANTTTAYLSLPANSPGYVSGVAGDPTDPATTLGVNFTLTDADTDVNSLTVTASSNNGNATLNLTGTGSTRNLKITPGGVGYATITITVTDGSNAVNYVVNYAASAASATQNTTLTRFHTGTSDASTAVLIDANYYLEGDDENQVLRLYNRQNSGLPVAGFDYTSMLGLTDISGGIPREIDIEASIRQGNRIFWIGSQSNKEGGGARPNRDRVFATDISGAGAGTTLSYVGRYDYLKEDIINWDVNNVHGKGANYYGLQQSADAATDSKAPQGYNIEGAELAPDGTTAYIGFRAPQIVPANRIKALIVPVTNLTSLVVSRQAQGSATFGAPIELDLGGRGIREIRKNANNDYIIIAGPAGDATGVAPADFQLYTWTGNATDAPVIRQTSPSLTSINANGSFESIIEVPNPLTSTSQIQLVVDNGDAAYYGDGVAAKDLPLTQNNFKKFRSEIVTLGATPNTAPVATANANQTATVGVAFAYTVNAFTDGETPNQLTYSASINPANNFSFDPATRIISGTPSMSGVTSVTVTATDPGSLSASTTFTITVSPAPVVSNAQLTVLHQDVSFGQTTTNTILPYLQLANAGSAPIAYSAITVRYWLTVEGNSPITNFQNYYVQIGGNNVHERYVPLATPRQGATAYVEYSFDAAAGSLAGGTNSGPIQNGFTKADYSVFNQSDDYSYVSNRDYTANARITAYVNGVLVYGQEPSDLGPVTPLSLTFTASPTMLTTAGSTTLTATVSGGNTPYSYTFTGPGTITPSGNTASVSGIPAGVQTYTVLARDATSPISQTISGTVSVTVSMSPANTAPVATMNANQTATVGVAFTYTVNAFTDAETPNQLTYSASINPANGLSFDPATRIISGTPSMSGVSSVSITATDPGSLSASTTFTITVNPAPIVGNAQLRVLHQDVSFGQTTTNTILPYLQLVNVGSAPIPYSAITVRYWLTVEGNSPITNFQNYYVQIGAANVHESYVPLAMPRQGATAYVEYRFDAAAGSLAGGTNSGPIQNGFTKADYSVFNQSDDYSYVANRDYMANAHITAYVNGVLVYGQEPPVGTRVGATESRETLHVQVLGNPLVNEVVEVMVSGAGGQSLLYQLTDVRSHLVSEHRVDQAGSPDHQRLSVVGQSAGVLLLRVSSPTQRQTVKVLKVE